MRIRLWLVLALLALVPSLASGQSVSQVNTEATADADDASVATGQTTALAIGLSQAYDGSVWRRVTFGTAGTASAQVWTVQGIASMTPLLSTPYQSGANLFPAAAAAADNMANPTSTGILAYSMCWDGATWDRCSGSSADTELSTAAAASDNFANPTAGGVLAFLMCWDGATWDRCEGEPAAALADNTANPTTTGAAAFMMSFDGTTWDRWTGAVTGTVTANLAAGTNNIGDVDVASIAAGDNDIGNVDLEFAGTAAATNAGANSAQTQRVTIATDDEINDDIQALVDRRSGDPCTYGAKLFVPISQTASTQLFAGTASNRTYVCSITLTTATAQNVALVSGTGTVCDTSPGAMIGGATAATGMQLAANGGFALGSGAGTVAKSDTDADNVCLFQSGAGQVSGVISYVVAAN